MRKPVYHLQSRDYRVVSRPNGQWVAQHKEGEHGTNTQDHWKDQHRPTTYAKAEQKMYQLLPMRS